MASLKKYSKCLFCLFILFLIIYYNYNVIVYVNQSAKSENLRKINEKINLHNNNKWLVNLNIIQYSTYMILKKNDTIEIEGLIFTLNSEKLVNFIPDEYICILRNGTDNREIILEAKQIIIINKPLTKVICNYLNKDFLFFSNINVAILNKPRENNSNEKSWLKKINYQKASKIDSIKTHKTNGLAHCAYISNENLDNIENWILKQKELGMKEIRFYFKNRLHLEKIKDKFGDLVSFNDLNTLKNFYCVDDGNNTQKCVKIFDLITRLNSQYEQISLQDCYINYKYKYELVSSYGINELIIPRNNKNSSQNLKDCSNCFEHQRNYSLYDYSIELFAKTTQPSLIFKKQSYFNMNNSFFENLVENKNGTIVVYSTNNNVKIAFKINESPTRLIETFNFTKCIKNDYKIFTIRNDTHESSRSIFNTNRIKTIPKLEKSREIDANFIINYQDLKPAYYEISEFKISELDIDLEYYNFLIKINEKCVRTEG